MSTRKEFLRNSGLLLGGVMLHPKPFASSRLPEPGLQLFTLFKEASDDIAGTLKKVAAIGYKNIESAFSMKPGYYGLSGKEFSSLVKDLGMTWRSHHVLGAPFKMPQMQSHLLTPMDNRFQFHRCAICAIT